MLLKSRNKISTMNEIAAECRVSLSTVYRILRHPEKVRTPLQQQVRALLMQNRYLPEYHPADAMTILNVTRRGSFFEYLSRFYFFLQKICLERKINLVLCEYEDLSKMIPLMKPAGLIFNFFQKNYCTFSLPFVAIQCNMNTDVCTTVCVDDMAGICALFAKLKELGHRRIFYFSPQIDQRVFYPERFLLERAKIFYQPNDLPFDEALCCFRKITPKTHDEVMKKVVDYYLALPDRPTAIVTAGDVYCEAFYTRFHQLGIRIPEDVSIAGFENLRRYRNFLQSGNPIVKRSFDLQPPVTTCDLPEEIAACAIELLLEKISNPLTRNKKLQLMADIVIT